MAGSGVNAASWGCRILDARPSRAFVLRYHARDEQAPVLRFYSVDGRLLPGFEGAGRNARSWSRDHPSGRGIIRVYTGYELLPHACYVVFGRKRRLDFVLRVTLAICGQPLTCKPLYPYNRYSLWTTRPLPSRSLRLKRCELALQREKSCAGSPLT